MAPIDGKRPRVRAPAIRQAAMLNAAVRLFAMNGYDATSVAEIAAAAGVAKGTFYLYFRSKQGLLDALRETYVQGLLGRMNALIRPTSSAGWRSFMDRLVALAVDEQLSHREWHDVIVHSPGPAGPGSEAGDGFEPIHGYLRAVVIAGVEAGVFGGVDPLVAGDLLFDLLHATGQRASRSGDPRRLSASASLMCWRALGGQA